MNTAKSLTATWETWIEAGAIAMINRYKSSVSPYKGYTCPHRLVYGEESCSDFVKRVLIQQSLSEALNSSYHRFKACNQARHILRTQGGCLILPCCLPIP